MGFPNPPGPASVFARSIRGFIRKNRIYRVFWRCEPLRPALFTSLVMLVLAPLCLGHRSSTVVLGSWGISAYIRYRIQQQAYVPGGEFDDESVPKSPG